MINKICDGIQAFKWRPIVLPCARLFQSFCFESFSSNCFSNETHLYLMCSILFVFEVQRLFFCFICSKFSHLSLKFWNLRYVVSIDKKVCKNENVWYLLRKLSQLKFRTSKEDGSTIKIRHILCLKLDIFTSQQKASSPIKMKHFHQSKIVHRIFSPFKIIGSF